MTKSDYIYNNNTLSPRTSYFRPRTSYFRPRTSYFRPRTSYSRQRTSYFRKLLQYQQQCSYCRMIGHNETNCLLRDIEIDHIKSSCENSKMRPLLLTELIPKKYWVQNCDPVKLFLNNNNIHNYRTQQEWKKKNYD